MEKNRLQKELDKVSDKGDIINLTDTNFHKNGYRFPKNILKELVNEYIEVRCYDPDSQGDIRTRRSISQFYSSKKINIDPEDIILTASSSESYNLLFNNLTDLGDNVILPQPTYPLFEFIAEFNKLESRFYKMEMAKGWDIDIDSLREKIDKRTRFIVLISPNNPTGQVIPQTALKEVINLCYNHNVMLISDEVFSEFVYEKPESHTYDAKPTAYPSSPSAIDSPVVVFTINGISKMFASPDLKLSWCGITGNKSRVKLLVDKLGISNDVFLNCNAMSQYILPDMFRLGGAFQEEMISSIDKTRHTLLDMLSHTDKISFVTPTAGIHAVLKIEMLGKDTLNGLSAYDDEDFSVGLLNRKGVYLHPGYFYGLEDGVYVVISFLKKESLFRKGLERLIAFVENGF
jgi:aspartate/methionine/tyrosine aminotransferase